MTSPEARTAAYEEAIQRVAVATVTTRAAVRGFDVPQDNARHLLCECEAALSALIALGAVPPMPGYAINPPSGPTIQELSP